MIRVTIELISAVTHEVTKLGQMFICNDGGGSAAKGDYNVYVNRKGTEELPREMYKDTGKDSENATAARLGTVKGYPRLSYNVWRLIGRAVLAAFPEERNNVLGKSPKIDAQVVRGLEIMRKAAHTCTEWIDDRESVAAAEDWLDAGLDSEGAA